MSEASSEKILESLSPEHQERLRKMAADDSVTIQVWVERAIMRGNGEGAAALTTGGAGTSSKATSHSHTAHTAARTIDDVAASNASPAQPNVDLDGAAASRLDIERETKTEHSYSVRRDRQTSTEAAAKSASAQINTAAAKLETTSAGHHPSHRAGDDIGYGNGLLVDDDVERDTIIEERTDVEREGSGGPRRTGRRPPTRHDSARIDSDISDYHSRLAERSAAAEDVPLTIWLEQAILAHARHRKDKDGDRLGTTPSAPPPPAPPQPSPLPASPPTTAVISETAAGGRGLELIVALILGALLVIALLLLMPWIDAGRSASSAATRSGISNTVIMPPTSASSLTGTTISSAGASSSTTTSPSTIAAAPGLSGAPGSPGSGGDVTVTTIVNGADSIPAGSIWPRRGGRGARYGRIIASRFGRRERWTAKQGSCDCTWSPMVDQPRSASAN